MAPRLRLTGTAVDEACARRRSHDDTLRWWAAHSTSARGGVGGVRLLLHQQAAGSRCVFALHERVRAGARLLAVAVADDPMVLYVAIVAAVVLVVIARREARREARRAAQRSAQRAAANRRTRGLRCLCSGTHIGLVVRRIERRVRACVRCAGASQRP